MVLVGARGGGKGGGDCGGAGAAAAAGGIGGRGPGAAESRPAVGVAFMLSGPT